MSETPDSNPSALPIPPNRWAEGMTLRDYFAANAPEGVFKMAGSDFTLGARYAYEYADAMLAAREAK